MYVFPVAPDGEEQKGDANHVIINLLVTQVKYASKYKTSTLNWKYRNISVNKQTLKAY